MAFVVATIVEGHGEVTAFPELLRRMEPRFHFPRPIRIPRTKILSDDLLHYVRIAMASIEERGGHGAIVVLFDADDDCAAVLGPKRAEFAATIAGGFCHCVLAVREFEAWILAGVPGLFNTEANPEGLRDCKGQLARELGHYRPTADQTGLAVQIDVMQARQRSPSFDKLCRTVDALRQHADSVNL